jgi:L-lactate dehydrogenase complex protein LldE
VRVALFVTCLTDTCFPRVGEAVVRVLRHYGCRVEFPLEQTCCGQPAFNAGFPVEARSAARRMLDIFAPYEFIVTPSASCAATVREHYAGLFGDDPETRKRAERLAARTHEFAAFLVEVLDVDIPATLRFDEAVTFHYPCHARHSYSPQDMAGWLACREGCVTPPEHVDLCCGFGGTFSVDFPEISGAMLSDRLSELNATGARTVICNEGGCTLNLMGGAHRRGLPLRFKHLAESLAESLGLMRD